MLLVIINKVKYKKISDSAILRISLETKISFP